MLRFSFDSLKRHVGNRIRQFREAKGWTLDQLAKSSGLAAGYLGQIERGKDTPSLKTLSRLADSLGVSMVEFLPKSDSASPTKTLRRARLEEEISSLLEQADTRKLTLISKLIRVMIEG